jgi:hypothetical protein
MVPFYAAARSGCAVLETGQVSPLEILAGISYCPVPGSYCPVPGVDKKKKPPVRKIPKKL